MRNKYEFKIEEITSASIQTITDKYLYTTIFNRKDDNEFIITYSALVDHDSTKDGIVKAICNKCGRWSTFNEEEFYHGYVECNKCSDDYEEYCSETDFIKTISAFMDEEIFKDVIITINEIQIQ